MCVCVGGAYVQICLEGTTLRGGLKVYFKNGKWGSLGGSLD